MLIQAPLEEDNMPVSRIILETAVDRFFEDLSDQEVSGTAEGHRLVGRKGPG